MTGLVDEDGRALISVPITNSRGAPPSRRSSHGSTPLLMANWCCLWPRFGNLNSIHLPRRKESWPTARG
jgi:hypothetical protein